MEKRRYLRARGTEKPKKPKKSAEAWGESDVELDSKEERRARSKKSIYSQKFSADVAEEILEYFGVYRGLAVGPYKCSIHCSMF